MDSGSKDCVVSKYKTLLLKIEALRSKLRRIFDPQGIILFPIRSLTPQQATGNALAAGFKVYNLNIRK